jgi:nicotinic acid mononucleotide adenylyltransferase
MHCRFAGSDIRQKIFRAQEWEYLVPLATRKIIKDYQLMEKVIQTMSIGMGS